MLRPRSLLTFLLAFVATAMLLAVLVPTVEAQNRGDTEIELEEGMYLAGSRLVLDPSGVADVDLVVALAKANLLDTYLDAADVEAGAAMIRLTQSPRGHDRLRSSIIATANSLARGVELSEATEDRIAQLRIDLRDALVADPSGDEVHWIESDLTDALDELDTLLDRQKRAGDSLRGQFGELHALRRGGTVTIDGLTMAVFDSYLRAEAVAAQRSNPDCRFSWTLFAGIGRIESKHGTINGASVARDGQTRPNILGPLLDGGSTERQASAEELAAAEEAAKAIALEEEKLAEEEEAKDRLLWGLYLATPDDEAVDDVDADGVPDELLNGDAKEDDDDDESDGGDDAESEDDEEAEGNGFAVIVDTDNGTLDGNDTWDRAVGPMQFIPETWQRSKTDGNGDGRVDPHNMYDAVASASTLLCTLVEKSGPNPSRFIRGYNDSRAYVADVIETSGRLSAVTFPRVVPVSSVFPEAG